MKPTAWLRIEGAVILAAALWLFSQVNGNWWLFAGLLFVFDISMVGYLKNPKIGAILYNAGHSLILPLVIWVIWREYSVIEQVAVIWIAHIGMDRAFGYGLKFSDKFEHTHLGTIGKSKR